MKMKEYLYDLTEEFIDLAKTYDPYSFNDAYAGMDEDEIFIEVEESIMDIKMRDTHVDFLNEMIESCSYDKLFVMRCENLKSALMIRYL